MKQGQTDLNIQSYIKIATGGANYGSWSEKSNLFYGDINTSDSLYIKGIVFKDKIYSGLVASKNFFYLPYRNLNDIYCNADGWNSLYTSDGKNNFRINVDLWEGDCKTLATKLQNYRTKRIDTINSSLKRYNELANLYILNMSLLKKESQNSLNIDKEISNNNEDMKMQKEKIKSLQDAQLKLDADVRTAELQSEVSSKAVIDLNSKIDITNAQIDVNNVSISNIENSKSGSNKNKTTFEAQFKKDLETYNNFIKALKSESPNETQLFTTLEACPTKSGLSDCAVSNILPL
jgi:hypothetical protein